VIQVFENIRQCLTLQGAEANQGRHPTEEDLGVIEDAAVVVEDEVVRWVGSKRDLPIEYSQEKRVSAGGRVWLPSLVECHTHLVFAGSRAGDFAKRCRGMSYQEVAKAGGGILSTVAHTREATKETLLRNAQIGLSAFESRGVGCLELKSGYGLTLESELKLLEVVQELQKYTKTDLLPTFMPAHAVPPEFLGKSSNYVDAICSEWIPEVARRKLAVFFDVFVEEGYFSVKQARQLCAKALESGFKLKLHADQFSSLAGAQLGVELGAVSCDHLENISEQGIEKMARSSTVAVLAPGASLFTSTAYAPARRLIDEGAIVALSTDFNPGTCPSHSLPLMMTIACAQLKLTIPEVLVATTLNAARALGREKSWGCIAPGRAFSVWQVAVQSYEEIPYSFGEAV
jgi:imidazolonepropionase